MEFDIGNGPLIYGESSRYWQNINFAMLALAFGNSVFLGGLFKISSKSNLPSYKRITIQNNQAFLGFSFFSLFTQCFFIAGIITSAIFDPLLFSIRTPLFVLIALVLFLENWRTIIRLFRGRAFKRMIINFAVLVVLTLLFAATSIFDYQKMDAIMLAQNPHVDVPESSFKSVPNWYHGKILKLIYEGGVMRYQVDGKYINLDELKGELEKNKYGDEFYNRRGGIYLMAPKSIPMGEIWKVQDELYLQEKRMVLYVTSNPKPMYTSRFELNGIEKRLSASVYARLFTKDLPPPPLPPDYPSWPSEEFISRLKIVKVRIDDGFVAQGERLSKDELLPYFKKVIDSMTLVYFEYDADVSFGDYLALYGTYRQAIFELRESDALVKVDAYEFQMGTTFLDSHALEKYEKDQDRLREKYPTRYIENYEFEFLIKDSEEKEN